MKNLKKQLVETGKKLAEKGLSPGLSGNLSTRFGNYFLVTPSGQSLGDFTEDDVVLIDKDFRVIDGKKKPSSESKMHLEIYKLRPDFGAIIHCHAPKASAFAVAGVSLSQPVLSESIFHFGDIPIAEYYVPSSVEVAKETAKYFDTHNVVLMKNHGVVLGDENLKKAYYQMETVEYTADVIINAKILGGAKELTPEQVQEVIDLRAKFGK